MSQVLSPAVLMTPLNGTAGGSSNKSIGFGQAAQGRLVTNPYDCGAFTNGEFDVDLLKTNVPIATALPAGSLQLEISGDGNGFWPIPAAASNVPQISAPVAVTAATEGRYPVPFASTKGWKYGKLRYILTGGVTISAIQAAATTTPASAVNALAQTPDGLYLAMVTTTAAGINIYSLAQTTTPLGAAATTTNYNGLTGTSTGIAGWNFLQQPLSATNNQYWLAGAGGTTPFFSVIPVSSAGVAGTALQPTTAPAITAGKCAFWHPNIIGGTGGGASTAFVGVVGTTTPFLYIYAFNPVTGTLGAVQTLGVVPAVGNLTFAEFSPDGNWLMVCGGTTPFVQIFQVTIIPATAAAPAILSLGAAITTPATVVAGAALCCRWHPTMERVAIASASAVNEYAIYRQSATSSGTTLAFGPKIPDTSVNGGVLSCRYTPDGSHILIPDTLAGKMFQAYPLKDCSTAWGTVQTGPTVATGITQGNDALVTLDGQYLALGGAGGSIFHQIGPWNLCAQMTVTLEGMSAN